MGLLKRNHRFNNPVWFLLPVILYYAAFWIRPTISIILESFTDKSGAFSFSNYIRLFSDDSFKTAFINTIVFTLGSAIIQFILAFFLALWLNKKFPFSNLILFITLIPMAFPPAAVGILWKTGLYRFGWINSFLSTLGLMDPANPIDWMSLRSLKAVILLIIVDTWTVLPSVMIILLAGLQNLNKEYEEAGWVFGANKAANVKGYCYTDSKTYHCHSNDIKNDSSGTVWLIAVMIFGYNVVPFLVERIAYNVDVITFGEYARKDAYTISVLVTIFVLTSVSLYLRSSPEKQKRGK